jgi:hypothetical protein
MEMPVFKPRPFRGVPRLILAHTLEHVKQLHTHLNGPDPVPFVDYAREHGMFARESGITPEEALTRLKKETEHFTSFAEVNLYHILPKDADPIPEVLQRASATMPWSDRATFLAMEFWYVRKDDVAINCRHHHPEAPYPNKINLNSNPS